MPDPLNMASSGKKGKKSKGKTLPLNDFLQETPGTPPAIPIRKPSTNWAEEVEDSFEGYEGRQNKPTNVVLPTAPKAARGLDDFSDKIPQNPPFIAYLSNLPYDIDEDEIADFFCNLKISNMRIPKEDRAGEGTRVKGFGYVEFEDQESLVEALAKPLCTLKGRRIRIEVATNSENDRRRGGGRMDMNRDRPDRPEVSTGDWRSGGRKEPEQQERRGGGGGGFNRDRGEGGFTRDQGGAERSSGAWRDGNDRPSFRDDRPSFREDRPSFRDDRFKDDKPITRDGPTRDRYERDGGERRGGFGPRRMDREDRNGGYARRDEPRRDEPPTEKSELRSRPKLNLAPRTKPVENPTPVEKEVEATAAKPAAAPAASIFGNAKPVDTTARERQIEERLAKQNVEIEGKKEDEKIKRDDARAPRRASPDRRRYSPRRSPEQRRTSPNNRRASPDRRRASPDRKKYSPERRRASPDRRWASPDRKKYSPERRRASPDRRRVSPERRRVSPERRRISPERRRASPERRRASPDKKRSPDRNRGPPPRRTEDRKVPLPKNDKLPPKDRTEKEKRPPREFSERDMPKLKTPEPMNIVATNQYSFLDNDSD